MNAYRLMSFSTQADLSISDIRNRVWIHQGEAPKQAGEIQARMLIYQIARVLMPVVVASRLLHGDDAGFNTEASNSRLFSGYQMLRNDR
jgi:hypothetical protein